jgi:hypothetical protein
MSLKKRTGLKNRGWASYIQMKYADSFHHKERDGCFRKVPFDVQMSSARL